MGQQLRVMLLADVWGWDGDYEKVGPTAQRRITAPKGTVYEGFASDVLDGFFDLNLPDGAALRFYVDDPTILIIAL